MPFFCRNKKKSKKTSVTLQVRNPRIKKVESRKRASFSASASLTLEAALVLPLLLYAGAVFITLFRVMDIHRQVQARAECVSQEIGQGAYLLKYTGENKILGTLSAGGYAEAVLRRELKELPVERLSLIRSSLLEDGETIDLVVDYEISMPFSVLGLRSVKQTNRCFGRAWTGRAGRNSRQDTEGDTSIVYLGKNSTRYHVSPTCHYLHNDLTAIDLKDIDGRRNQSGSRYTPCARCKDPTASKVYIMPSGRHYHTSPSCSAINAYVRTAIRSEVEYLGACSYCSGDR